ncbi:MAG: hypothetical protein MUO76_06735, partial [Anaerolineaceae bacterium]|nr:hypothetical protein [Anaerolineaceae bacterium]
MKTIPEKPTNSTLGIIDPDAMPEEQKYRLLKHIVKKRSAQIGGIITLILVICALFGNFIVPYDPFKLDTVNRLQPPSFEHFLGTDEHGRDVFSRIIYGSRYTVMIMLITSIISTTGGI